MALLFSRLPPPLTGLLPARGGQVAERRTVRFREGLSYQARFTAHFCGHSFHTSVDRLIVLTPCGIMRN